ncbi:hypothetical protein N0V90_010011 [Kalmusia sp. IMI 367209]|nr:hypothetical protein N0V90_010011 [Kalmusia sp. IMI 367209]
MVSILGMDEPKKPIFPTRLYLATRSIRLRGGRYVSVNDLQELLDRDWLHRVWTYQEILLASNAVLVCGHCHLDWAILEWSILYLCNVQYDLLQDIIVPWESLILGKEKMGTSASHYPKSLTMEYDTFKASVMGRYDAMVFMTSIVKRQKPHFSADDDLLKGLYHRQATNPKDMAYGMWSVLQSRGALGLCPPSHALDVENVYYMLTVHLIKITKSMEFLPMAAARGLPGLPSWVPDWSAANQHKWFTHRGDVGVDCQGWSFKTLDDMARVVHLERTKRVLAVSHNEDVLHVRAARLGYVRGCASFHATSDIYSPTEQNLHMENLQTMLMCAEWTLDLGYPMVWTMLDYAAVESEYPDELFKWQQCYKKSRRGHLETILRQWTDGNEAPEWSREFLTTQILICNLLAKESRKICQAFINDEPYFTACSHDVRINDDVIRIIGLPQLLVVRHLSDDHSTRAIRIISPMVVNTHKKVVRTKTDTHSQVPKFPRRSLVVQRFPQHFSLGSPFI